MVMVVFFYDWNTLISELVFKFEFLLHTNIIIFEKVNKLYSNKFIRITMDVYV